MGVLKADHHQGIGSQLIQEAIRWCQRESMAFLQVKTLAETHPDQHYQRTRSFYEAMGFACRNISHPLGSGKSMLVDDPSSSTSGKH